MNVKFVTIVVLVNCCHTSDIYCWHTSDIPFYTEESLFVCGKGQVILLHSNRYDAGVQPASCPTRIKRMGGEDERCCLSRADVITWSRLHSQHVPTVRSLMKQRENIAFLDADSSNSDQPSNLECRSCETEFYINSSVVSETKLGHRHRYLPNTICVRGAHHFFFLGQRTTAVSVGQDLFSSGKLRNV